MTTPVDINIAMPYGVTVEGDGVNRTAIPIGTSDKILSGGYISLPAGPCRVAVSWSGGESVRAVLPGVGYPVTLEAGGGVPLRDRRYRRERWGQNPAPKHQRNSAHQGRTRHYRGLPDHGHRVAHYAGAVV